MIAIKTSTAAPMRRWRARWCSGSSVKTESSALTREARLLNLLSERDRVDEARNPSSGWESRLNSWDRRIMD